MKHLANHIDGLANLHGIEMMFDVDLEKRTGSSLFHPDGIRKGVVVRPIEDEVDYVVALHEIGHHLHPTGRINKSNMPPQLLEAKEWMTARMEEERSAWAWARVNALVWTTVMEETAVFAYGTYEKGQQEFLELIKMMEMAERILGLGNKNESKPTASST